MQIALNSVGQPYSNIHVVMAPGNSGVIRKTVQPKNKFPVTSFLFFMHALCAHAQIYSKYKTDCAILSWNLSIIALASSCLDKVYQKLSALK